ncbi:hypothetical protein [Bdellovibrio sp. HCB288]|uniref:hypothetical protein n=2 Tax=unclassified Bdellovibrio TaxID=2633795 RepID=UPI0039B46721
MKRRCLLLLFMTLFISGCPTREQPKIPPPKPPEPQTETQNKQDVGLNHRQLDQLGGMAPLVGPGVYFLVMLA